MRWTSLALVVAACSKSPPRPATGELAVDVTAPSAGLSPEEAHAAIAVPLAREIGQAQGLGHLTSTSDARGVHVTAWFPADVDPLDASHRIEERVEQARPLLPSGAELPTVLFRARATIMRVVVTNDRASPLALRRWVDDTLLAAHVLQTPGAMLDETCGGEDARVEITADLGRLAAAGADLRDVVRALQDANLARGMGSWDLASLGEVRVTASGGTSSAVRDLARIVQRGLPEPCPFTAPPGKILVDLRIHPGADVDAIRGAIAAARSAAPADTTVEISHAPAVYDVAFTDMTVDGGALRTLAATWRKQLAAVPGVVAVEADPPPANGWSVDRNAVSRADLSTDDVHDALLAARDGLWIAQVYDGRVAMPVYLRVDPPDPARIMLRSHDGATALASLAQGTVGFGRVDLLDNMPAVIVRFTAADPDDLDVVGAAAIARARDAAPPPAGVTVTSWREP